MQASLAKSPAKRNVCLTKLLPRKLIPNLAMISHERDDDFFRFVSDVENAAVVFAVDVKFIHLIDFQIL